MSLSLLEVVASIQWIEPRLRKVLSPVAVAQHYTVRCQSIAVLAYDQRSVLPSQVAKSLDDAIGRNDREAPDHQLLEVPRFHDVQQCLVRIHDVCVLVEVPHIGAVWVFGQRMAHGQDLGP